MMKTSTCLHIVAVYDNTTAVFISWRYTGVLLGLTVLAILEPSLCEVVLLSFCRNRYFYLYTSEDVLLINNKLLSCFSTYCKLGLLVSRVTIQKKLGDT